MRTHIRIATIFLLTLLIGTVSAHAQGEGHVAEVGVMFWKPTPELVLSTDNLARAGVSEVDFVEEFALEKQYFPEFRATLGRAHKFRTSFVTFNYDAETTIMRTIVFQGRTFTIGAPATADIKWKLWKFGYEWDFVSRELGFVGVIADLKYNRVEASIDSPALASAAVAETTAPVPTFGAIARGYLAPAISVTGEFTGLSFNRDDFDAKIWDFDIYGTVTLGRNFGLQGGYRSVVVDYLVDEDTGDLKMKGLYFGAVARF